MREPLRRRNFLALGLALVALVFGSLVTWWSRRSRPRRSPQRRAPAPVHQPEDLPGSLRALFVALGPFAPRDVPDWIERFVSPARLEKGAREQGLQPPPAGTVITLGEPPAPKPAPRLARAGPP